MNISEEIRKISGSEPEISEDKSKNPYRVFTLESGVKTAYIFSSPVYSFGKHEPVTEEWKTEGIKKVYSGINASVIYRGNKIILENYMDRADIGLSEKYNVIPGSNGVTVISENSEICLSIKTEYPYTVRENGKSFSLMAGKHLPFISIAPFFAITPEGK